MKEKYRFIALACMLFFCLHISSSLIAQNQDSSVVVLNMGGGMDSLYVDSTKIIEDAALDIGQDRGLFIVTPDNKMQLRILGSVRYLIVYDDIDLSSKNSLITFEIPTGEANTPLPNYFNGLSQSRLGFEVTRYTHGGNVFIRLETDFAGPYGFRIRHAYGQYDKFLFGQTWSLFSSISSMPATVGFAGPTGSVLVRSPQIRYTNKKLIPGAILSLGAEYFAPEFNLPDSLAVKAFQLIPDLTARIVKRVDWGSFQLSGILPIITGISSEGDNLMRTGWGVSYSMVVDSWAGGKWYLQANGGQAIARYFHDLAGQGMDLLYDSDQNQASLPFTWGGYLTYEHHWTENLFSNFTYGILYLQTESFTQTGTYTQGDNFRFNTFWSIVDGARLGAEYIHAIRRDKGGAYGDANRVNLLFYYDF